MSKLSQEIYDLLSMKQSQCQREIAEINAKQKAYDEAYRKQLLDMWQKELDKVQRRMAEFILLEEGDIDG